MSKKQTDPVSAAERERRRRAVQAAIGNQALEGLHPDEEDLAEFEAYINGETTIAEMIQRTKEKYGGA